MCPPLGIGTGALSQSGEYKSSVGVKAIFGALPLASQITWMDVSICMCPAPQPWACREAMIAPDWLSTDMESARRFHGAVGGKYGRRQLLAYDPAAPEPHAPPVPTAPPRSGAPPVPGAPLDAALPAPPVTPASPVPVAPPHAGNTQRQPA